MEYFQFAVLTLLMMALSIRARSLNPNDVPNPTMNFSAGFRSVLNSQAHLLVEANKILAPENQVKTKISVENHRKRDIEFVHIAISKLPADSLSQSKDLMETHSKNEPNHSSILNDHHKKTNVKSSQTSKNIERNLTNPGSLKGYDIKSGDAGKGTEDPTTVSVITTKPPITTTQVDPWEEFCNAACAEGKAGSECDCAGHPIG